MHRIIKHTFSKIVKEQSIFLIALLLPLLSISQQEKYTVEVYPDTVISGFNKPMLLGTNVGVFYEESWFLDFKMLKALHRLNPGIIRMPGGSWSNELYWNGNKVRLSEESYIEKEVWDKTVEKGGNPIIVAFDTTRYHNGKWDVDYTGYAPGFRISDTDHHLSDFHGFTDVLFLHKFIRSFGAETMVSVNMGTGTPEMAAEWVKWTKQRENYARKPFDVKYWEMGNELDGDWELGHFLPDGSAMNAMEYVKRYKLFAEAMKKADPSIKVGGSVASSMELTFVEELIKDTAAPVDFISFHAYPSNNDDLDLTKMINEAVKVNEAVSRIKEWLEEYRPDEKENIEIAVTEWNIKVKEDITTVDIRNALWSAVMIGEMAKAGVDIAIQWDLFSTTATGGHGLFNPNYTEMKPRSQYWALYLWSRFMGNTIVETNLTTPDFVKTYATIENDSVAVMFVNSSETREANINFLNPGTGNVSQFKEIVFSSQQYQIDTITLLPLISRKPGERIINTAKSVSIKLQPYSIKIVRFPLGKSQYPHGSGFKNN